MQRIAFGAVMGAVLASTAALAQAPTWSPPPENQRCPSKWGAGDERGAGNHMKPQTVLNAAKLIKTGEVIELGHVLSGNDAVLRHAPLRRAHQAHLHEPAVQQPRQQRGDGDLRDRPGRHPVRRLRPPDPRQQPLQLLQDRRDRDAAPASPSSASTMSAR